MKPRSVRRQHLLVSLQDGIRNECGGDLSSAEPPAVESLYSLLRGLDGIEFHVNLALRKVNYFGRDGMCQART